MRGYFGLGQLSATEKSDILNQHKSVYNGYQTMQPQVANTQPLTVYDFAGDKEGLVVNNKGEVKKYTNMGINEQVNEVCDDCGAMEMSESECSECGGMMYEGICEQCGGSDEMEEGEMCEQCGGQMNEGICEQCGGSGEMEEETGHLDDIYKVKDLNLKHGDFDYVEGGGNDYGTFEGMHKGLYKEQDEFVNYMDNFEDPDNEDDAVVGSDDMQIDSSEMYEDETDDKPYEKGTRGMKASRTRATFEPTPKETEILSKLFGEYGDDIPPIVIRYLRKLPRKVFTKRLMDLNLIDKSSLHKLEEQGGNSDDMDVDNVEPAYDFESDGPMAGGDVYPVNEYDEDMEIQDYESMESAFSDEIDEVDISGSQGVYGDMDPAFDFDSEGPGKAGPYQEFSYEGETDEQYLPKHAWKKMARQQSAKDKGEDFDSDEFDPSDYEDLDAMSSWEDIKSYFGDTDWSEVDEDLQESFHIQKNKITEMFNRFNKYN
jgi:hypothetical protein